MAFQYAKAKSAAKRIDVKGKKLDALVKDTMGTIANIVGATLGPGGCPVLIERQEFNLPAMITKDGVTVMRNLGFQDPVQHSILEAARDAAVRTASEAGDGTTTATVLAEAIVNSLHTYCQANPKVSPQKVVRRLEEVFQKNVEPLIKDMSIPAGLEDEVGRGLLFSVAKVSANGDTALAKAVMDCFYLVGDQGNVTISETSGDSHYEVEKINGFPISLGLEDCCLRFVPDFINDPGTQRCALPTPAVLVYHGRVNSYASLVPIMQKVGMAFMDPGTEQEYKFPSLVIIATGFSDDALTGLAANFRDTQTMKAFPLVAPLTAEPGAQLQFLLDVCALTGATLLEQTGTPLEQAQLLHLGRGVATFEAYRFRSNLIMKEALENEAQVRESLMTKEEVLEKSAEGGTEPPEDIVFTPEEVDVRERLLREDRVLNRSAEVEEQLRGAPSEFTRALIQERLAKLTGGIARLKVMGASNGELKEKRDRAEDAVCGVRGAIKHGCLPGGCWTLLKVGEELGKLHDPLVDAILRPALLEPFWKLLNNSGIIDPGEQQEVLAPILKAMGEPTRVDEEKGEASFSPVVYDCMEGRHVDALQGGLLDSTPAVLEAIRNALSIASLLGTLGGTVVFQRDLELERYEAKQTSDYLREDEHLPNPADERP